MLSLNGHDVTVASDGVVAVALADIAQPQIAFLDIGMPRMDGYEAARADSRGARPGASCSSRSPAGARTRTSGARREAGFDHHLTKPPDPEVLEPLIAECDQLTRVAEN